MQLFPRIWYPKGSEQEEKEEPVEQDLITVDVKGAVKSPGIYDLLVGSRVNDAVQKAGGLTEQADSKSLNLAQKVSDEALVYVPTKEKKQLVNRLVRGQLLQQARKRRSISTRPVWKSLNRLRDWEENELRTLSTIVRQMGNSSRLMNSRRSLALVLRP